MRIYDFNKHTFTAPNGKQFVFRYVIENFVPLSELIPLQRYLKGLRKYMFIPIAVSNPSYEGFLVEDVVPYFLKLIERDKDLVSRKLPTQCDVFSALSEKSS